MRNLLAIIIVLIIMTWGLAGHNKSYADPVSGLEATAPSKRSSAQIVVYYFHRKFRCPSCVVVEGFVGEALVKIFPKEIDEGAVIWKVINIDSPENRHYYDRYGLLTNSLVVVDKLNGQEQHFRVLESVWGIYQDREAVFNLIETEVMACLNGD